jgi:hypothetical protein
MASIPIKSIKDQGLSKSFELDLLRMDFDKDYELEAADFEFAFGASFKAEDFIEIKELVKDGNHQGFLASLARFKMDRDTQFKQTVFKLVSKKSNPSNSDLVPIFNDAYQIHYGRLPEHIMFSGIAKYLISDFDADDLTQAVSMGIDRFQAEIDYRYKSQQDRHADMQYYESRHPVALQKLEQDFDVNIRYNRDFLTDENINSLRFVFSKIRELRPQDFALLENLDLEAMHVRSLARALPPHKLTIEGAFRPPLELEDPKMPPYYAAESLESANTFPTNQYLLQKLSHELGHLVAYRDSRNKDRHRGYCPENYPNIKTSYAHEQFAEDYSLYIQSRGERVMIKSIGGEVIPEYDKRLKYFQKQYPLAG